MFLKFIKPAVDVVITIVLWTYYLLSFFFFSPFYIYAFYFSKDHEKNFQKLNFIFYRNFFALVRTLIPNLKICISDEVLSIKSSVIIANHLSFLDPILFISMFERQKTIVKKSYFRIPIFGIVLKESGYISPTDNMFADDMTCQLENMKKHLAEGGNIFVFPEGTRSRNGSIGQFEKGAFRIAKLCRVPIRVVRIKNTNNLYPPDSFLFNTCVPTLFEVKLAGSIEPDYQNTHVSIAKLMKETRNLLQYKD
jgi:1-acyl-sn-glycerol-3-phosphate acyltransferase